MQKKVGCTKRLEDWNIRWNGAQFFKCLKGEKEKAFNGYFVTGTSKLDKQLFSPKEGIPPAGGENRGVAGVVAGQGDGVPGGVTAGVIVLNIPD